MSDKIHHGHGKHQEQPDGGANSGLTPTARRMDRYWLLTWTTYGTWLPGDERGFVSNIDRGDGKGHRRNRLGTEPASKIGGLESYARKRLSVEPIYLTKQHAILLLAQFHETAVYSDWELVAVAIMRNHIHLVVGVPGDPAPDTLLRDFKSYGSRKLNSMFSRPDSGTWWTESGSRRKLPDELAIRAGASYIRDQEYPLVVWVSDRWAEQGADAPRSPAGGEDAP